MPPRFGPQREDRLATSELAEAPLDDAESIADPGLRRIYKAARSRETA